MLAFKFNKRGSDSCYFMALRITCKCFQKLVAGPLSLSVQVALAHLRGLHSQGKITGVVVLHNFLAEGSNVTCSHKITMLVCER